ncbi:MAG: His/Gly/Thr/Pro-type tRNA ligase C-terminal domain-containing protein [bacterium]|nr:His/Gly/Thr/Pro-type tRNA ligase C-terminal domain-containing protein [bacterium]
MKQSQLFTKTRKESPKDEVSKNAELLIRGGFIHKELAGAYAYLPLGLRVIKKIENIIREEMDAIGGQEIEMTSLQEKNTWEKSGRWDDEVLDVWFKTTLKSGGELGLATTHEEPLTALLSEYVSSYRDLPFSAYQFQTKFRNELRAKSGLMRGREFLMKDLYSFSQTQEEHEEFYEKVKEAYFKIFNRVGLGNITYLTFASGGSFSKYSHEFQTLTNSGEDLIFLSKAKNLAVNKEVYNDEVLSSLGISKEDVVEEKAVEVGNIFTLGTKYSEPLGLLFNDENGDKKPVIMGSYGIGLGRVMGTIVETLSDEKGIVWPKAVAPFRVHLLVLGTNASSLAEDLYTTLRKESIEVLFDDRDLRAGEKFADSDLLGIPFRVIVGDKTLESKLYEVKDRATGEVRNISLDNLIMELKNV